MEPTIKFALFCENVENRPDGKMHLTSPYVSFPLPYIPGVFSFSVVAGIDEFDEKPHTIKFEFVDPEKKVLLTTEEFNVQMNGTKPDGATKADMMVNLDFKNLEFRMPGDYQMNIYIDKQLKGGYPISAVQVKKGE